MVKDEHKNVIGYISVITGRIMRLSNVDDCLAESK